MNFQADLIEEQIATVDEAWELLNNKLPKFKDMFVIWQAWYQDITTDTKMQQLIVDAVVICYARMAYRNGTVSINPRCYHNETHIDDLLYRLIAVSKLSGSKSIPNYGWSILSLFMSSHDLRQSEKNNPNDLIGSNEQASYQEVARLLTNIDTHEIIPHEQRELLKIMIHGSTFGRGEDTKGNIYQGNMVQYLLQKIQHLAEVDVELIYLACDIDTANVAADLADYAQSSINVYNEFQNISAKIISAKDFFGKQQQQYFFTLQQFNSKLGVNAFTKQKQQNAVRIDAVCKVIKNLSDDTSNEDILNIYLKQIEKHS